MDLKDIAGINVLVKQLNEIDEKIEAVKRNPGPGFAIYILGEYEAQSLCERLRSNLISLLEADRVEIINALSAAGVQV